MESGIFLFKSRVAKRIFFLFLLCAMIPISVFSYLSFSQVSSQLKEQSLRRIQNTTKSYGLIILERFKFLEMELDLFGESTVGADRSKNRPLRAEDNDPKRSMLFKTIAFISNRGTITPLLGTIENPPENLLQLRPEDLSSKTRILFEPGGRIGVRVFIAKKTTDSRGNSGILVGEATALKLWGIGYDNILPPLTDLCILDHNRNILFSSFSIPDDLLHSIRFDSTSLESRSLTYTSGGAGMIVGYWPMFLKSSFDSSNLIIVLRNTQKDIFAPVSHFKLLFPLVTLLAFWIVLLLSIVSIRKSLIPLETLKNGALSLAQHDFSTRIDIQSGDEFESLANAFNKSSESLGRHFRAMDTMAEIDRAVHSSLNTGTIIQTAMKYIQSFFNCDTVCFGILHSQKPELMRMFSSASQHTVTLRQDVLTLRHEDRSFLTGQNGTFYYSVQSPPPSFIPERITEHISHFMILPMFHNKKLSGIICIGHKTMHVFTDEDMAHGERIASQLSSALSNAILVEELKSLNLGTLEALARTVDAKSKWTAGHSERVADLSIKIATIMGLDQKSTENLQRAAFLHDIGKIGIPMAILNKPGKLTDEEYQHVREHPVIGAKIIEPIDAFADTLPIILQHHERYDGKGYPQGLKGQELDIGARILAVADVYDAIISNRPYRLGGVKENVVQIIKDESGKHFDPNVVDAFLAAIIDH